MEASRTIRHYLHLGLIGLGCAGIVLTFLPLIDTTIGFIRLLDFPRWEVMAGMLLILAGYLAVFVRRGWQAWLFVAGLWIAIGFQAAVLARWTPLAPDQALAVNACAGSRFRIFSANVEKTNHDAGALLDLINATNPDIVLLMETDARWDQQLQPLSSRYPYTVKHVTANSYGIHLFSRIALEDPKVEFVVRPDVPSIYTGLALPNGHVRFYAIHPRPPGVFRSTTNRDAELMSAALTMRSNGEPALLAGDLNSVPWESVVRRTARIGGLLDPRIGREFLPTYDATSWLLRIPVDQVLFSPSFALMGFRRLGSFGSDHYPIVADLCYAPDYAKQQTAPAMHNGDLQRAQSAVSNAKPTPQKPKQ